MFGSWLQEDSVLGATLRSLRSSIWTVVGLSALINLFAIASSIYLLMIYDRVLPSGSMPTLFSLLILFIFIFIFHGIMDVIRSHVMVDCARAFGARLAPHIQQIQWRASLSGVSTDQHPTRDMDQIRGFASGPGPNAFLDLPWIVIFLAVLFLLHIWLGVTALLGILILAGLTLFTERKVAKNLAEIGPLHSNRSRLLERNNSHAPTMRGLGMFGAAQRQWAAADNLYLDENSRVSRVVARSAGIGRIFRIFLQSAVLTVGALLVISGQASAGIIFASSILAGRALAPIDQAIGQWRSFVAARQAWQRLDAALIAMPLKEETTSKLPAPCENLTIDRLTVVPPESKRVAVADISFSASAGEVIGVIGPSGSGKSSLLRAIAGAWPLTRGHVRLDGASLNQWDGDDLGRHLGFLPQEIGLMEGSVAENIARISPDAHFDDILDASKKAGMHDLAVAFPEGYDTQIGPNGSRLSAGQRQRVALARALYGDPFLLLLDEPNSNLDPKGEAALAAAIIAAKKRGAIVLLATHQMPILKITDKILVMGQGKLAAWGPREKVLKALAEKSGKKSDG